MTIFCGRPYVFMMRLRNFSAAAFSALQYHRLQDLAFMIDGAPEIAELAVDLHEGLIQMPPPLRIAAHARYPLRISAAPAKMASDSIARNRTMAQGQVTVFGGTGFLGQRVVQRLLSVISRCG